MSFLVRHAFLIAFVSTLALAIPSVAQTGTRDAGRRGVTCSDRTSRNVRSRPARWCARFVSPRHRRSMAGSMTSLDVAPAAVDLTQRDPDNGQAMTRATRIQFAYDDRYPVCGRHVRGRLRRRRGDGTWAPRRTTTDGHGHDRVRPAARSSDRLRVSDESFRMAGRLLDNRRRPERSRLQRGVGRSNDGDRHWAGLPSFEFHSHRCDSPHRQSPARCGASTCSGRYGGSARTVRGCRSRADSAARCRSTGISSSSSRLLRPVGSS